MKLSRQPCPVCKEDTLHFVSKCRQCGHVNESPSEARRRAQGRLHKKAVAIALRRGHPQPRTWALITKDSYFAHMRERRIERLERNQQKLEVERRIRDRRRGAEREIDATRKGAHR